MTNKESLTALFNEANRLSRKEPKYTTHDLWEMAKQIEKDLKILEILKYRIHLKEDTIKNDTKDYDIAWIKASGFVFKNSEEYTLLKEWSEHDK